MKTRAAKSQTRTMLRIEDVECNGEDMCITDCKLKDLITIIEPVAECMMAGKVVERCHLATRLILEGQKGGHMISSMKRKKVCHFIT